MKTSLNNIDIKHPENPLRTFSTLLVVFRKVKVFGKKNQPSIIYERSVSFLRSSIFPSVLVCLSLLEIVVNSNHEWLFKLLFSMRASHIQYTWRV